ncbi:MULTISPECIES: hypothetical protein [Stenotrophomonas]|uniref:hypothetical protein n=1 Tax=Stenotrophomonas sp. CC120223-11 TaxID=1378090 RepID=UPI000BD440C2|nr:hypothetical protein [Stenotrophomonas sp. CC120223-11]MCU1049875.1 hypothetical protein [Stenotrophomonas maltophilia]SNY65248.1 hypothetical protein SAMN02744784_01549 [Stenotrophomonas sp. CC120223-11]
MNDTRNAIKDAIERQVRNGDWTGIAVDDGRYEGSMGTLDIDPDSIEVEEVDLEAGTITVTARGTGSATYKDADGEDVSGEYDVSVTSKVSIDISGAEIVLVTNDG